MSTKWTNQWVIVALIASACQAGDEQTETLAADGDSGSTDLDGTDDEGEEAPSTWSEQIAFSTSDGRIGIYEVDLNTITMFETPEDQCAFGDWSPDGRYMAFGCEGSLWFAWGDGSHTELRFEGGPYISNIAWSPDGEDVAFYGTLAEPLAYEIWVVPAMGGEARQVTDWVDDLRELQWSPDGARLALRIGGGLSGYSIHSVELQSGAGMVLFQSEHEGFTKGLSVSHAGVTRGFIAYSRRQSSLEYAKIWAMDFDGGGAVQLSNYPEGSAQYPVWSPDGMMLAWTELRTSDWVVRFANADGSSPVTYDMPHASNPLKWSPDQTRLVTILSAGNRPLTLIDLASGEATQIEHDSWFVDAKWRPSPPS